MIRSDQRTLLLLSLFGILLLALLFHGYEPIPNDATVFPDYSLSGTIDFFASADSSQENEEPFFTPSNFKSNYAFQIDLNGAEWSELIILPGIGPKLADKIIDYRKTQGTFRKTEEIQNVKGIGPKKFAKMAPFLKEID